jgi:hypothetical protein
MLRADSSWHSKPRSSNTEGVELGLFHGFHPNGVKEPSAEWCHRAWALLGNKRWVKNPAFEISKEWRSLCQSVKYRTYTKRVRIQVAR